MPLISLVVCVSVCVPNILKVLTTIFTFEQYCQFCVI